MRDRFGLIVTTGLDRFRDTTVRVGHMGLTPDPCYILPTLAALDITVLELGHRKTGSALEAAQAMFLALCGLTVLAAAAAFRRPVRRSN